MVTDQSFDRVLAVQILYFWSDPLAHFREIHRVCRAGARFAFGFGAAEDHDVVSAFPGSVYRLYSIDEARDLLSRAGFIDISVSRRKTS